jgi:hypothetical protein
MYTVLFDVWRGFSSATSHEAGEFNCLDDAKECARKCNGYVITGTKWSYSIIADYRIN